MFILDTANAPELAAQYETVDPATARAEMLDGGFMNTVVRVADERGRSVILKQALPTIRAFPDIAVTQDRLGFEYEGLSLLSTFVSDTPVTVPQPLYHDTERNIIAMSDLGPGRRILERALCDGEADAGIAAQLGEFLVALHNQTADSPHLANRFHNQAMHSLRLEHCFFGFCDDPRVLPHIEDLAADFTERKQVLLHGDFWTASVLVDGESPGVYDLEFCNYGDPAQDLGFMLAHYMLHYHNTPNVSAAIRNAVEAMWNSYQSRVQYAQDAGFERRVVQQIGVEVMFRVMGLNTVAYVTAEDRKQAISDAGKRYIVDDACGIAAMWS